MATVTRERDELRNAAIALRAAQRSYMAVRSTPGEQREQAGKAVEAAAHRLDAALASPPAEDCRIVGSASWDSVVVPDAQIAAWHEARFTQAQVDEAVKPLFAEIERLKSFIGRAAYGSAQAPPASDPPGLVASLREQVRQWRDRASGIDDDNSYHFNSERHARANQMDECADEIEELLPASPQAKED